MSRIKEKIFVGNYRDASNLRFLESNRISHILCCARELQPYFPEKFKYLTVQAGDVPQFNMGRYFNQGADFIHSGVSNGTGVFIHCAAGVSRSVTLTIAYFMKYQNMTVNDALSMIRARRWIANPNPGFMKQLREWEGKLRNDKNRMEQEKVINDLAAENIAASNQRNYQTNTQSKIEESVKFGQAGAPRMSAPVGVNPNQMSQTQPNFYRTSLKQNTGNFRETQIGFDSMAPKKAKAVRFQDQLETSKNPAQQPSQPGISPELLKESQMRTTQSQLQFQSQVEPQPSSQQSGFQAPLQSVPRSFSQTQGAPLETPSIQPASRSNSRSVWPPKRGLAQTQQGFGIYQREQTQNQDPYSQRKRGPAGRRDPQNALLNGYSRIQQKGESSLPVTGQNAQEVPNKPNPGDVYTHKPMIPGFRKNGRSLTTTNPELYNRYVNMNTTPPAAPQEPRVAIHNPYGQSPSSTQRPRNLKPASGQTNNPYQPNILGGPSLPRGRSVQNYRGPNQRQEFVITNSRGFYQGDFHKPQRRQIDRPFAPY